MGKKTIAAIFLAAAAVVFSLNRASKGPIEEALDGQHQFTVLADTDHRDPEIMRYIADNMHHLSDAGVKHIMLEIFDPTPKISDHDFDLTGTLEEQLQQITKIDGDFWAHLSLDVQNLSDASPDLSSEEVVSRVHDDPKNKAKASRIFATKWELEKRLVWEHFFENPSEENAKALRENSFFLGSANSTMEEENVKVDQHTMEIIIRARQNGITVHYTNDRVGEKEMDAENKCIKEKEQFLVENPGVSEHFDQYCEHGVEYVYQLDLSEAEKNALFDKFRQISEMNQEIIETTDKNNGLKTRVSPEAEKARADLFIDLADGERAVIVWGAGHFYKHLDIDEYLDQALGQSGLLSHPTRVIEIWGSSEYFLSTDRSSRVDHPEIIHWIKDNDTYTGPR